MYVCWACSVTCRVTGSCHHKKHTYKILAIKFHEVVTGVVIMKLGCSILGSHNFCSSILRGVYLCSVKILYWLVSLFGKAIR